MPTTAKQAKPGAEAAFEPIAITSRPADAAIEMVTLFEIDGKAYQIPAKPDAGLALQVVEDAVEHGSVVADLMMLKRVIGDEGFQALKDCGALTGDHLRRLSDAVTKITLGALEDEESGNS
jgi:hypothetical protein